MKTRRWNAALLALSAIALVESGCRHKGSPAMYQVFPVERRNLVAAAGGTGVIQPVDSFDINTRAAGEVLRVGAAPGDAVKRGQVLLELDPRLLQSGVQETTAQVAAARIQLETAEGELSRARDLYQTQAISVEERDSIALIRDNASAALSAARIQADSARIALGDATVSSPVDGVVLAVHVDVGTVISSATRSVGADTTPLVKIADINTVEVLALVNERDISGLREGMDVSVAVDAYPDQDFTGRVGRIEPQALVQNRETFFPVHVILPNRSHFLKPGMNTEISIRLSERQNVLTIPYAALRTPDDIPAAAEFLGIPMTTIRRELPPGAVRDSAAGDYIVFTRRNGQILPTPVRTGTTDFAWSEVDSGLTERDTVLVLPSASLFHDEQDAQRRLQGVGVPGTTNQRPPATSSRRRSG